MKEIIQNFRSLSLMLSIPILNIFYVLLNNAERGAYSLMTDLDRNIPFVKEFIIPYVIWYFFVFGTLVFFCLKDKKVYYQTLLSIDLGLIICYITYFVFQTHVPRPELIGDDILTKLVALIYFKDQPYNAFPSIHVLLSFLMIKGNNKYQGRNFWNMSLVYINGILIILSTLFVKQHVVLDVFAGIVLGNVVFDLVYTLDLEKLRVKLKKPYSKLIAKNKVEATTSSGMKGASVEVLGKRDTQKISS